MAVYGFIFTERKFMNRGNFNALLPAATPPATLNLLGLSSLLLILLCYFSFDWQMA